MTENQVTTDTEYVLSLQTNSEYLHTQYLLNHFTLNKEKHVQCVSANSPDYQNLNTIVHSYVYGLIIMNKSICFYRQIS